MKGQWITIALNIAMVVAFVAIFFLASIHLNDDRKQIEQFNKEIGDLEWNMHKLNISYQICKLDLKENPKVIIRTVEVNNLTWGNQIIRPYYSAMLNCRGTLSEALQNLSTCSAELNETMTDLKRCQTPHHGGGSNPTVTPVIVPPVEPEPTPTPEPEHSCKPKCGQLIHGFCKR